MQFVFGYGSLAADRAGRPAELRGHRRVWGVAMDNSVDVAGYKHYRLRADGSRPAVFVAFLDIVADEAAMTAGVCTPVDADALAALDERERNYERIDVTAAIADPPPGTVWAYAGSASGRARLRHGRARGRAVVSRGYLRRVAAGLGIPLDTGGLPVWDLARVDDTG